MANINMNFRNIGISAHIDSGKTTLTERILYYSDRIHMMHEVRGKDGVGAFMDSMELEKERGITIASAATNVKWKKHSINIIDTPGHVDFTIEVERALRVLDGAVLVLCSVGGVQSQSITVDRQLKRYNVPSLAFVNKCDRVGADPLKVTRQINEKLGRNAIMMQIPIGLEQHLKGVVDLVTMKACYFEGLQGNDIRIEDIPDELKDQAVRQRELMLDTVSMFSDELAEAYLEGMETEELIRDAIRKGTISFQLTPVFMGSAYKNIGVQPLLDSVCQYLPSPKEVVNVALDLDNNEKEVLLKSESSLPTVALAFKLEDGQYGQLTYIRIYQGMLKKGYELVNSRSGKKITIGRLIRMHSNNMEDITSASCGDIVALFGIDCRSGDTLCSDSINYSMTSMFIPQPVISLAIKPNDKKSQDQVSKALNRFNKEDPTFTTYIDNESKQTIIRGMGELHLEVYIERMRREYNADIAVGRPQVAYREAITKAVNFDYTHKKQTGGSGQYGRVCGILEPNNENDYEFVNMIKGGVIPAEYISSCDKGFKECLKKGTHSGFPITGIKVTINDGNYHPVDSSDKAFINASIGAFRKAYENACPRILEPVMKVTVESPPEFQGSIFSSINQRRGIISSTTEDRNRTIIEAEVPLHEMFGYSTVLRSQTQGKAEFTMEFFKYKYAPLQVEEQLKKEYREKRTN
ncbi:MAG: elongation factor G [Chitinispirillia bacterium]|jgi:elongation factor G